MVTNVLEYLEKTAVLFPDKAALVGEDGRLTFSEFKNYAMAIGSFLRAETNAVNRPIGVFVGRNCASIVSFMGVLYSGNFYVPIDAQTPPERLKKMLERLEPTACIVAAPVSEDILNSAQCRIISYEDAVSAEIDELSLSLVRNCAIDVDPAYTIFTSGSTGIPKGAVICHRGIIDLAEWLTDTFGFSSSDVIGSQTPFYFDASVKDIYTTIKSGATMHILSKKLFSFPASLVGYLNQNKITTVLWATSAVRLIANSGILAKARPEYLKKIFFAGENMPAKHINIWRKSLPDALYVNLYGPTEITVDAAYHVLNRDYADDESIPIGIPCRNKNILLFAEDGRLAERGETGEICVRGSGVSFGYYNEPQKTKEAFIQNPLNKSYNEVIYKTGDLARYNEYGELVFISRADAQVKHMGNRIELGEIERAVYSVPETEAACCVYDFDKEAIVLVFQGNTDKLSILKTLEDKLPKYMFPSIFIKLSKLPENANGKINRQKVKDDYLSGVLKA